MKIGKLVLSLVAVALLANFAAAEELRSGLQPGDRIGAFYVVKAAGAEDDGVPKGEELCYRCKLGRAPVVAVFAHTVDKNLVSLVKELDSLVADNEQQKMASFVNLLGTDKDALENKAKQLVKASKAERIPVVVPVDSKNGPKNIRLSEKADVTIMIYRKGIIEVNHTYTQGQLNEKAIAQVIKDTATILN